MRPTLPLAALTALTLQAGACTTGAGADSAVADLSITAPPDCRTACPGAQVAGIVDSSVSGDRYASVWFAQSDDCKPDALDATPGFHTARAGAPCRLADSPGGAFACEEFHCGETSAFRASACVSVASEPGTARAFACADRDVACALAREVEDGLRGERDDPARGLCR